MTLDQLVTKWMPDVPVEVRYTRNRCIMISCRKTRREAYLRVHHVFRHAPADVARAVVGLYLKRSVARKERLQYHTIINEYIDSCEDQILRESRSTIDLKEFPGPVGSVHDLKEVFARLNREYFGGRLSVFLTWTKNSPKRSMGTWLETPPGLKNVISINRILDSKDVPQYVLREVVYHEMLHEAIPVVKKNGRKYWHTPQFRKLERAFPDYERATRWVHDNWDRLCRKHHRLARKG